MELSASKSEYGIQSLIRQGDWEQICKYQDDYCTKMFPVICTAGFLDLLQGLRGLSPSSLRKGGEKIAKQIKAVDLFFKCAGKGEGR